MARQVYLFCVFLFVVASPIDNLYMVDSRNSPIPEQDEEIEMTW